MAVDQGAERIVVVSRSWESREKRRGCVGVGERGVVKGFEEFAGSAKRLDGHREKEEEEREDAPETEAVELAFSAGADEIGRAHV